MPEPLPLPAEVLDGVSLAGWQQALQHPPLVSDGAGDTPLVRVGSRLYLRRYWQYEQSVRAAIDARLAAPPALPEAALRGALGVLFPPAAAAPSPDWQKLAQKDLVTSARGYRAQRWLRRHALSSAAIPSGTRARRLHMLWLRCSRVRAVRTD